MIKKNLLKTELIKEKSLSISQLIQEIEFQKVLKSENGDFKSAFLSAGITFERTTLISTIKVSYTN